MPKLIRKIRKKIANPDDYALIALEFDESKLYAKNKKLRSHMADNAQKIIRQYSSGKWGGYVSQSITEGFLLEAWFPEIKEIS